MQDVVIYTDGACDPNPGPGGWAAILRYGRHEKAISGSAPQTTNNRMELCAALSALGTLKRPCHVILHTDSEYLRRGISEWLPAWQRRGWRTSNKQRVQNQDLWQALAKQVERHEVEWRWVRSHAGDPLNERVDHLARAAIPRPVTAESEANVSAERDVVQLYTRASCRGAPGDGGWAVVRRQGDQVTSLSGSAAQATANEMEIRAAIQGLASLTQRRRVEIYTVSKYVAQGATRWIHDWEARGWRTRSGKPVQHKGLWLALKEAMARHKVEWHLLAGDEHPPESQQAAKLAAEAAHTLQEENTG